MSSTFGKNLRITVFGQSHSAAIGCTVDGLPAGIKIDLRELEAFMQRRAPGSSRYSTARKEADKPEFLCGVLPDADDPDVLVTCGAPLTAIIRNSDAHSSDYSQIAETPRPGHADFAARVKYGGYEDVRGGGHFSGRLTAPLCIIGGILVQELKRRGISVGAHIMSVGNIADRAYDPVNLTASDLSAAANGDFPVIDKLAGQLMKDVIDECRAELDSVGGMVECGVVGLPAGIGSPMFGSVESRIAEAVFAVPAVKGIEFGRGFAASELKGSENNDPFYSENGVIKTKTNNHGGVLGGISSGMPLIFRTAFKPTPSIAKAQDSVLYENGRNTVLEIKGRHDPCVVPRAVPVIEAVTAAVIFDMLLDSPAYL